MKNIYNDNGISGKNKDISSGSFEFEDIEMPERPVPLKKVQPAAEAPQPQQNTQQGYYAQPPQPDMNQAGPQPFPPPYYQPYYPQGIPVQLTPEQLAVLLQQYSVPPQYQQPLQYQQPTQTPGQDASDSGRRILYQSADFDMPVRAAEESYEDEYTLRDVTPAEVKETGSDFVIEEETITMPSRTAGTGKPSMQIEEMEMSTFELNSMLSRQPNIKGAARQVAPEIKSKAQKIQPPEPRQAQPVQPQTSHRDAPLNFGSSFSVEETVNETAEAPTPEKKKKPVSEIIRLTVLGISIAAIVISVGMLLNEYRMSRQNENLEEEISDLIVSVSETTEAGYEDTTAEEEDTTKKKKKTTTTKALSEEEQWAQIKKEFPRVAFPTGIQLKYARLYATNRDFVGYLEAKGIKLSLPVVQGKNDDVYLKKNFYGVSTKYGCPFVTHLNHIKELDQNTIIFGHHMNNGTVFGALDKYKKLSGFKAAPVITFNTLYQDYSWKVIAAFITNAYEKDDNGYVFKYYFTNLSTQDRFAAYLSELSQRSLYDTGVDVLPTDKLLTLSTCSYEFDDARFVVVARLVRPGESKKVDVSKASENPNPRYPQAYYKKKKISNPYKNAYRWEVG